MWLRTLGYQPASAEAHDSPPEPSQRPRHDYALSERGLLGSTAGGLKAPLLPLLALESCV